MELIKLVYKYINRYINSKELLKRLNNLDLKKYSKEEITIISKLILDIENIINKVPNEVDEIEKMRLENNNNLLEKLKKSLDNGIDDLDAKNFTENLYNKLLKDKEKVRDGGKLYQELFKLLDNNLLIQERLNKMSNEEMLDLITEYIKSPMTPNLNQDEFNDLVYVAIKGDERESIWRLAFNYSNSNIDFSLIEDYFIEKRDDYYLGELISAVSENLDIDKLLLKIKSTKDKEFISKFVEYAKSIHILDEKQIKALE